MYIRFTWEFNYKNNHFCRQKRNKHSYSKMSRLALFVKVGYDETAQGQRIFPTL